MAQKYSMSVNELVEFIHRSGDVDSDFLAFRASLSKNHTEKQKQKIHQSVLNLRMLASDTMNFDYYPRQDVFGRMTYQDVEFTLDGRMDGVAQSGGKYIAEKIIITETNLKEVKMESNPIDLANLKFCAYLYLQKRDIAKMSIRMCYVHYKSKKEQAFEQIFTRQELFDFCNDTLSQYYKFVKLILNKNNLFEMSAEQMKFPYDTYRKGQRDLLELIYRSSKHGYTSFANAPTGIGKTMSSSFAAIKALGEGNGRKIFYLTSKSISRTMPLEALNKLEEDGLMMNSVALTARSKICLNSQVRCNPKYCKYAKGHLDRVNDAIYDLIKFNSVVDYTIVQHYSEKHTVCPHELQLDTTNFSKFVIADYNYFYEPKVSLRRYFSGDYTDFIMLVDEAHNLKIRSKDMYSAAISTGDFILMKHLSGGKLEHVADNVIDIIESQVKDPKDVEYRILQVDSLIRPLEMFKKSFKNWIKKQKSGPNNEMILDVYFKVDTFLKCYEHYDENYRTTLTHTENNLTLKLVCIDPINRIKNYNKLCRSINYFSATMEPINYFRRMYFGTKTAPELRLTSPFKRENLQVMIDYSIPTYYKTRHLTYIPIARKLHTYLNTRKGNYFVFFSSYEYLNQVYNVYTNLYPDEEIVRQTRDLNEEAREAFLRKFTDDSQIKAFVILGGMFSEGIDLPGKKLIGAAIIGVGLAATNLEDDLAKEHFNSHNKGYEYAYVYPGFNKVMQAIGRVIRTENDCGSILLIDERYRQKRYQRLLPKSLAITYVESESEIVDVLNNLPKE